MESLVTAHLPLALHAVANLHLEYDPANLGFLEAICVKFPHLQSLKLTEMNSVCTATPSMFMCS